MNGKDAMKQINEKIGLLSNENRLYYEDMFMYIRYNASSDQYTEETLLELLEHLLDAQNEGRNAKSVFGNDPKTYCERILSEIPRDNRIERFFLYQFLKLFGVFFTVFGAIELLSDSVIVTFHAGTILIDTVITAILIYLFIFSIRKWIKKKTFAERNASQALQILGISIFWVVLSLFLIYIIPSFGPVVTIHAIIVLGIGIAFYGISSILNKKSSFQHHLYKS